jgi:hypothetical protein
VWDERFHKPRTVCVTLEDLAARRPSPAHLLHRLPTKLSKPGPFQFVGQVEFVDENKDWAKAQRVIVGIFFAEGYSIRDHDRTISMNTPTRPCNVPHHRLIKPVARTGYTQNVQQSQTDTQINCDIQKNMQKFKKMRVRLRNECSWTEVPTFTGYLRSRITVLEERQFNKRRVIRIYAPPFLISVRVELSL